MQYFVTGATGFIGKRLVKKLLSARAAWCISAAQGSAGKVAELRSYWGVSAARAVPCFGDLTSRKLGVSAEDVKKLKARSTISTTSLRVRPVGRCREPGRP